ncbi:MAG: head-tail adaptor protein [Alphaproteobacteria bacterium]|nr:MAG: head-tail adaptor protein [Alphaproteobacteria bacterium]
MRSGSLRDRVVFEAESLTPDGGGGNMRAWVAAVTTRGQFIPERGRERLETGRLEAALGGVLRVRSSAATRAITPEHRVTINGDVFQIRSVSNPDRRNKMIEMSVERGVAT